MLIWIIAILGIVLSFVGCYFYPFKRKKALMCWAISYPLSFYVLFKALSNIFG